MLHYKRPSIVACVTMLLFDRPSVSIVALLRKRNNVFLSHCRSSVNVIEPREPHTCNNMKLLIAQLPPFPLLHTS
jgi:hypothetical protein